MTDLEFEFEDESDTFSFETEDEDIIDSEDDPIEISKNDDNDGSKVSNFNEVIYRPWTVQKFVESRFLDKMDKLHKAHLPNCTTDELLIMLQYKKWQTEDVINSYFDDQQKFYESCGLPFGKPSKNTFAIKQNYYCVICCETRVSTPVYSLTCGHEFCINCYYHYINNEISNSKLITCIIPECPYTIPHRDIDEIILVVESANSVKVRKALSSNPLLIATAKVYIDSHENFKWCPATDCTHFTEIVSPRRLEEDEVENKDKKPIDISIVPIVGCADHHEFCFECNYENHLPCPCWIVRLWIKKCEDDSETANWIDANTNACPKCQASIEKNGGCNHMTCRKCQFNFCWICLGDWKDHNNSYYSCNKFKPDSEDSEVANRKIKSKVSLQRYLHFYKRFSIHESSMQGDQSTLSKLHDLTMLYMENRKEHETNLSWTDIQFLPDAFIALANGRKTLKWTYCFAYYLADSNFSEIFESNQDYLNKTVEDLSGIFQNMLDKHNKNKVASILKHRSQIINLSELITSRRKMLISGAEMNLKEHLLRFEA
ncbi:hypothetical protein G9P44_001896 [Scheffersomyces stipitis]|nr:hypothetical protein G9P44_001896 [Scheffersomyces stipitis]